MTRARLKRTRHRWWLPFLTGAGLPAVLVAQAAPPGPALPIAPVGLFIASIEEGARIFTPVRLLPFEHPEALGHEFPTVLQFHRGEDRLLVALGRPAGLLLATTLQRYPTQPDTTWPYPAFRPPPDSLFAEAPVVRRPSDAAPLPGLRAVGYLDGVAIAFIVDTRGLTLTARGMTRGTSSGLDVTRAQLLDALASAGQGGPHRGGWILVFDRAEPGAAPP